MIYYQITMRFIHQFMKSVIKMAGAKAGKSTLKERIQQYEYEIILFAFFILRFIFKNLLRYQKYFNSEPIFGLSDKFSIAIGTAVMLAICFVLAIMFGRLIRANGSEYEKPVIILVALFVACPVTLPFLFDISSLSGSQMLYPFALFIIAISFIGKHFLQWFIPIICALYFIPALYSSEIFFTDLYKGAILYVPLILLFLFLDAIRNIESGVQQTKTKKDKTSLSKEVLSVWDSTILRISLLVSVISYVYCLIRGRSYGEAFFYQQQKLNLYFLAGLLIAAPLLIAVFSIIKNVTVTGYLKKVIYVFFISQVLLFPLYRNNYYGLWIPFFTISLSVLIFYCVWLNNAAMLSSVKTMGDFLWERKFLFFIVLIAMASLSNVSSDYISTFFKQIFEVVPY